MDETHVMVREATYDGEAVYVCPVEECGRRLVINWRRPELTVVDRGDVFARHVSATPGLRIGASLA